MKSEQNSIGNRRRQRLPDDFLADLPGSRRKVYYLMSIHEHLPPQARKGSKRSGMDGGIRVGQSRAPRWSALRLCNLVAQSARNAEGRLQVGSGKGIDGKRGGTIGVDLLQSLQGIDALEARTGTDQTDARVAILCNHCKIYHLDTRYSAIV